MWVLGKKLLQLWHQRANFSFNQHTNLILHFLYCSQPSVIFFLLDRIFNFTFKTRRNFCSVRKTNMWERGRGISTRGSYGNHVVRTRAFPLVPVCSAVTIIDPLLESCVKTVNGIHSGSLSYFVGIIRRLEATNSGV